MCSVLEPIVKQQHVGYLYSNHCLNMHRYCTSQAVRTGRTGISQQQWRREWLLMASGQCGPIGREAVPATRQSEPHRQRETQTSQRCQHRNTEILGRLALLLGGRDTHSSLSNAGQRGPPSGA